MRPYNSSKFNCKHVRVFLIMNILGTLSFVFVYGVRFIKVKLLRKGNSDTTPSSVSDAGYTRNE